MTCIHRNPAPCLLCAFIAIFGRPPQTPTLRVLTADEQRAEDQAHERAEDAKWERKHGGTDWGSDRAADGYGAWLDRIGGSSA